MAELKTKPVILTTYHIIKPGQTFEESAVEVRELPREPGYDLLRTIIEPHLDGKRLEHVSVLFNRRALDMFVDETGLLDGLPRNETATAIYRAANLAGRSSAPPVADPEMLNFIAGTAVLFMRRVWF